MIARLLPALPVSTAIKVFIAFILAAVLAYVATPRLSAISNEPSLENTVPRQFGDWRELANPYSQVSLATGPEADLNQPYDQTVMRTYVNSKGQMVMLALAWGRHQRQEVKVHRPDLCYVAQGYKIEKLTAINFKHIREETGPITGKRMLASANKSSEAVSYWIRIGSIYSEDAFNTRLHILKEGFQGRIPDGILVRASMRVTAGNDAEQAWAIVEQFLSEMVAASPLDAKRLMLGKNQNLG